MKTKNTPVPNNYSLFRANYSDNCRTTRQLLAFSYELLVFIFNYLFWVSTTRFGIATTYFRLFLSRVQGKPFTLMIDCLNCHLNDCYIYTLQSKTTGFYGAQNEAFDVEVGRI